MKDARSLFEKGDKVELTEEGQRVTPGRPRRHLGKQIQTGNTGVVVGFCRDPQAIRVVRDGSASPEAYHIDFWKKIK
jgi:hypothetical protein